MTTIEHLNARFRQIGYTPKSGAIAFNLLAQSLQDHEMLLYLLEGSMYNTLGYLIATDTRVFYAGVDKHKLPMLEHIDYYDIESIQQHQPSMIPSVEIMIKAKDGTEILIKGCEPKDGNKFVKLIRYLSQGAAPGK